MASGTPVSSTPSTAGSPVSKATRIGGQPTEPVLGETEALLGDTNPANKPPAAKPPEPSKTGPDKGDLNHFRFCFELRLPNCGNALWPPTQELLRGRWSLLEAKGGGPVNAAFAKMPDLPGLCIEVDTRGRRARIFDPLSQDTESAKRRLEEASLMVKHLNGSNQGSAPTREYEQLSDNEIKLWCYWSRRYELAGNLKMVKGSIPTELEMNEMPGLIPANLNDPARTDGEFREPLKPVKPKGQNGILEDLVIDPDYV